MGRRRIKNPIIENIEIIDVAAEGKAIAKSDDMVIFVSHAVPGDMVDLRIIKKKKNYSEGIPVKFHKYSADRIEPVCKHFGVCGGCKWQQLPYEKQLFYKQKQVVDNLTRIGKTELPEIRKIISSPLTEFYRNKLEYTFSAKRWLSGDEAGIPDEIKNLNALGFHVAGKFDKILDIEKCYLQPDPCNEIRLAVKNFACENNFSFYDIRNHSGYLRNLIIRNTISGQIMVIFVFNFSDADRQEMILNFIADRFPEITSLLYVINPKSNEIISDLDVKVYKGSGYIIEEMNDLKFKIGPKSFFQTNSIQAKRLYEIVLNFAQLKGDEIVYDLYTGTGTIANFIARHCKKVIGIESIKDAIDDAIENAEINEISNAAFFTGDIKDVLNDSFVLQNGKPSVIITDPPRFGMFKEVVEAILKIEPEKIVYVSCNPATQARDIALLSERYRVADIQPVDMFPHTHHVENVVLLIKKKQNE